MANCTGFIFTVVLQDFFKWIVVSKQSQFKIFINKQTRNYEGGTCMNEVWVILLLCLLWAYQVWLFCGISAFEVKTRDMK